MHSLCPECDERLSPGARQCVCGWKNPAYFKGREKALVDPDGWRCSWTNGAHRCRYPGSMSHGLKGDAKWLCAFHFREGDPSVAARITEESYEWDGKAESFIALRKASQVAKPAKPASAGAEERKGAYAASVFRDDEIGASTISIANAALAGLAPRVQSEDADAIH